MHCGYIGSRTPPRVGLHQLASWGEELLHTLGVEHIETLARLAATGNQHALGELVRSISPKLRSWVSRQMPASSAAVEDVMQETWAYIAAHAPRYEYRPDTGGFQGWVFAVSARKIVDSARRSARQEALMDRLAFSAGSDGKALTLVGTDTHLDRLEVRRLLAAVSRVLTREQAEVLRMRFWEGLSSVEIGELTGRKAATVRQIQARALMVLRREIEADTVGHNTTQDAVPA